MSTSWKTVRVFISSTFRDMQAERDWLVRFVFPKLREELVKYRIHLVDVDLRWGVTSDQDALGVCREVIDDCHPRFIGVLGGRYGWVPEGRGHSITADEIHYGVLEREAEKRGHAFFYFRKETDTLAIPEADARSGGYREYAQPDEIKRYGQEKADAMARERDAKLADLKQSIIDERLPVFIYDAKWDAAQQRLTRLEAFGNQVHTDLFKSLKNDSKLAARFADAGTAQADEFAEERDYLDAFIEDRTDRFVLGSRQALMDDLLAFAAEEGTPNIFVLTGEPGSGKSAFLAEFTRKLSDIRYSAFVIPHFIGASTGSTDLRRTLRRLCYELANVAGNTEPLPIDIKELIKHFQKLLTEAGAKKPAVLVLDALNQFDATDGAYRMNWLPRELPPDVRVVASVVAPSEGEKEHLALAILRNRKDVRVEELKPLNDSDTLAIIEVYLKRYSKRLDAKQITALKEKPASNLPLYVLTALEELRTLGTFEEITERIEKLPDDARSLFRWILTERLARDPGFRDREGQPCGAALVEKFAACLGVSRHGLSPAELTALLDPGDPLGNVAALLRLLRPYLMRRGELLDFYHGQFREATEIEFLQIESHRHDAHAYLATQFNHGERTGDPWHGAPQRSLTEFPYHLWQSGATEPLFALADDDTFLEAQEKVPTEPNLFLLTIEMALRTACRILEPLRMAALTLRRARKTETRREANPILALDDQSLSFADRVSRAQALAESLPPQVGVYSTLLLAYRLNSIGAYAEALDTVERLGERRLPELGKFCGAAILLLAELEEKFQTTRWAKPLVDHPALLATLSERLAKIGNVSAALRIADQVENLQAKDFSFFEIVQTQIRTAHFVAALKTARRIGGTELRCSALIDILRAGRSAGFDLQIEIENQLSSMVAEPHGEYQRPRLEMSAPYSFQRAVSGAISSSEGNLTNQAVLYAELGQISVALNLAEKIQEPGDQVEALCGIALVIQK